jgi:hypothetical protein
LPLWWMAGNRSANGPTWANAGPDFPPHFPPGFPPRHGLGGVCPRFVGFPVPPAQTSRERSISSEPQIRSWPPTVPAAVMAGLGQRRSGSSGLSHGLKPAGPHPFPTATSTSNSSAVAIECHALLGSSLCNWPGVRAKRGSRRWARDARAASNAGPAVRRVRRHACELVSSGAPPNPSSLPSGSR